MIRARLMKAIGETLKNPEKLELTESDIKLLKGILATYMTTPGLVVTRKVMDIAQRMCRFTCHCGKPAIRVSALMGYCEKHGRARQREVSVRFDKTFKAEADAFYSEQEKVIHTAEKHHDACGRRKGGGRTNVLLYK
jgi:hypothetical protein